MLRGFKFILKSIALLLSIIVGYGLIALIFTNIVVNKHSTEELKSKTIYIQTNGIHLDIIIPKVDLTNELLKDLNYKELEQYFSFGWGDKNFYINTPFWSDLTFNTAFKAVFLKSATLLHLTRYQAIQEDWIEIEISESQLISLNSYISNSFTKTVYQNKIILPNQGYRYNDDFYEANGSYSFLYTCNTWANSAFKKSKLKACLWTPFDFGLINKYKY